MNKELQDLAWSCLPKEFKEEVKKEWQTANNEERLPHDAFMRGCYSTMVMLFGIHNLTSDAEGDDELLTVTRKDIVELYQEVQKTISQCKGTELATQSIGIRNILWSFFGSKCLPDEVKPTEFGRVEEPNPAEPRFKIGDIALVRGFKHPLLKHDGAIVTILSYHDKGDFYSCAIAPNVGIDVDAKYLEPYTEPQPNCTTKSDTCQPVTDRHHFEENRLHIAAMAMQGLLANGDMRDYTKVAKDALAHADALIAESNKETNKQPK